MMPKNWHKTITGILICTALFGLPIKCFCSNDISDTSKIDDYVTSEMKNSKIPGLSIGVVKGNDMVFIKGYGEADKGRIVTGQTSFEIGSISKSFTALSIMQLKEKGQVDLDSPVSRYLPWFKAYYQDKPAVVTVRELLNQNGGIPTYFDNDAKADASIEEVAKEKLNGQELVKSPGSEFLYSNGNYVILGEIVQAVSGQSYKEYIEKNIFTPLQMKHSYVSKQEAEKDGLAAGYRRWFGIPVKADLPYFKGNAPCGHIISCSEDMCHYLAMFLNEGKYGDVSVVSSDGVKELLKPAVETLVPIGTDAEQVKYAMGWGVNYKQGKIDAVEHTGETSNYHSHAIFNPSEKVGVIEMDNAGGYITDGQIAPDILKIATNRQPSKAINIGTIFKITNLVYILIAALLAVSAVRLRHFRRRISKSRARFAFNLIFTMVINLLLPVILIFGEPAMLGASWKAAMIFSPDITFVWGASAIILFIIGIIKTIMVIADIKSKKQARNWYVTANK